MKAPNFIAGVITIFLISSQVLGQESGWRENGNIVSRYSQRNISEMYDVGEIGGSW